MTVYPVDQWWLNRVAQAQKERFHITPCPECGGPLVHSKDATKGARCFRCGHYQEMSVRKTWRKCKLCGGSMQGTTVKEDYCTKCSRLSLHERNKRLRWKAERASSAETATAPK